MQDVDRSPITFAELLARPGVVEILDLQGPVGFCAFHGGNLERITEQIASEAAARSGSSFYGVIQPRGMRHHIPSTLVDPAQSPKLAAFVAHCQFVIAVHGYGLQGHFASLLCGGGNRDLARHVARHIRDALPAYETIDDIERIPRTLRGLHPDNPCNLTSGGGMQLELPPRVRGLTPLVLHWPAHDHRTQRFPHVNHLIDGLIQAARSWAGPDLPTPADPAESGTVPAHPGPGTDTLPGQAASNGHHPLSPTGLSPMVGPRRRSTVEP